MMYILGSLQLLDYLFTTSTGSVAPPDDFGIVASIDGRKFRIPDLKLTADSMKYL
jgi:elongator complex protein 1